MESIKKILKLPDIINRDKLEGWALNKLLKAIRELKGVSGQVHNAVNCNA